MHAAPHPRLAPHLLACILAVLLLPGAARAQAGPAVAGAALGTVAGGTVTLAVLTVGARAGHYVHAPSRLRWELLPVPLLATAGGVLGHDEPDRLWRSVGWGAGGTLAGAALGSLAGRILWGDSQGIWSGTVVGGAAGLLAGALVGALTWDGPVPSSVGLEMRLPFTP